MSVNTDVLALAVSVFALVLTLVQYLKDNSRTKNEATLDAYNELQDSTFSKLNCILRELDDCKDERGRLKIDRNNQRWEEITNCLAKIERFSVGVNSGIYSIKIVRRVSGGYMVRLHEELSLIIEDKTNQNISEGKHYNEFEALVRELAKK